MAVIKITVDYPIEDGMSLTFKSPCNCTDVTGIKIYYKTVTDSVSTSVSKTFIFRDAHGNNLSNSGNLFVSGAYIKIILDLTNGYAYIQNADTNGYLENKLSNISTDVTNLKENAIKVVEVTATLTSSGWVGSEAPYTQDVTISGMTQSTSGIARVNYKIATQEQRSIARGALLCLTAQSTNKVTITADGVKPTSDIPIVIQMYKGV